MSRSDLARSLALAALFLVAGCGDTPVADCGPGTSVECPSSDEVVAGVNLTDLFATPTNAEVDAAHAHLASGEGGRTFSSVAEIDRGGRETVTVLRGDAGGTEGSFFAAVRQPPRAPGDQRQRPLVLFLSDGEDVDLTGALRTFPLRQRLRDDAVIVLGVRRGGTLRVDGQTFESAASGVAPFDPALSADMLALVGYVRSRGEAFGADPERVALIGHGPGGTAALLAGARTGVDDYILSLAAPTSFFAASVRQAAREYLRGGVANPFPGLVSVLDSTAGQVRDGRATMAEARLALLTRSPADLLPPAQRSRPLAFVFAAHGEIDSVVPIDQMQALTPLVREADGLLLPLPDVTHETILQDAQVLSVGAAFVCERLFPDDPNCF